MPLTREQIRAKMMNFAKKTQDFDGTLPGLEELNGELSLMELSAADTTAINRIAADEAGYNNGLDVGATVARGLVLRGTKDRIFSDLDAETVSELGLSVLMPIVNQIKQISGLTPDAIANAKKNSPKTSSNGSDSSSTETPALRALAKASKNS